MNDNQEEYWGMPLNTFSMLLHLSQLSSIIIPGAGIILPFVMWASQKNNNPVIDRHGRNVLNWVVSSFIYMLICIPLSFIVIGLFMLPLLGIVSLVFSIIGAIKANSGEYWEYPLSITFFKAPGVV